MKLKLDENLGIRCRDLLIAAGHDVATVCEQGLAGADDPQVIAVCGAEGRCIVTLDLDFANPLNFPPAQFAGIAVLRLPQRPCAQHLAELARTLIGGLSRAPISGQLWIVEHGRIREYQPDN